MNFTNRLFHLFSLRLFLVIALSLAGLTAKADIQPGREYELLALPQPVETGKKIEVLEIFSYVCPHCFNLEPEINKWAKHLPKDVVFRRLPAIFNASWAPSAKAYFTFEAMGLTEKLHEAFFNAIHLQHMRFDDDDAVFDWAEKHGVNRKKFADTYNSFSVQSEALRSKQLTQAYGVSGVPTLIVDGKFRTSVSAAGGHAGLLSTLDQLIKKARPEHASK
ncbi:MAG TPA: thiol:disulfide interchange protein DsbA/DsbL [Sulfuricella sp.]|nr:thiol:disulfide interchange protein DsbA/DsbL [Sulfuricella sp.]